MKKHNEILPEEWPRLAAGYVALRLALRGVGQLELQAMPIIVARKILNHPPTGSFLDLERDLRELLTELENELG